MTFSQEFPAQLCIRCGLGIAQIVECGRKLRSLLHLQECLNFLYLLFEQAERYLHPVKSMAKVGKTGNRSHHAQPRQNSSRHCRLKHRIH